MLREIVKSLNHQSKEQVIASRTVSMEAAFEKMTQTTNSIYDSIYLS